MLSFLHRWDYCWKSEFDTVVQIENYYHHAGEQLGFYKKVHIKTQSEKRNILAVFILQETQSSNLLDKNYILRERKFSYSTWWKFISMNRNWTGKLQVILLSTYISWKKLCLRTFKTSSEEIIVMHSEKMKANIWRRISEKVFFVNFFNVNIFFNYLE